MDDVLAPNRRNVGALLVVLALLGGSYVLVSDPVVRYGTWLVVFAVYMLWVVLSVVGLLESPDAKP